MSKWLRWCIEQARSCGITNIRIEYGGRHPRLVGQFGGHHIKHTIPRAEGDPNLRYDIRAQLKRLVKQLEKGQLK
jgi:hypothetical protein